LPFPITGYFEALQESPSIYCQLDIEVTLVVHELCDGVLEPIHRETPIARVAINRP